jgi:hypothetical protein
MLLWSLLLFRYVYPAQTHYVPATVWRRLLQRLKGEIAKPHPQASFRGSLVDENMFAIDVNEWGLANLLEETRRNRMEELERSGNPPASLPESPHNAPPNRQSA